MERIGQWRCWIKVMINRTLTFSRWRLPKSDITPKMLYKCYISSRIFQSRSLLESEGNPRKISNFWTSNIPHINTWRQNAKAVGIIITVGQCFFFPWRKKKVPMKAIFGLYFDFFTGSFPFSRPLFGPFFRFVTPTFIFFTGSFFVFTRGENLFSRAQNLIFFTAKIHHGILAHPLFSVNMFFQHICKHFNA